jgi:flavin reductase (DIM6/NTAB) family NADH-FMN oxidoreductase RutF
VESGRDFTDDPSMRKTSFPLERAREHLETGPVVLVTSAHRGERNVQTLGWHLVMEFEPSLWGCYIWDSNRTRRLVERSRECVVNVPTVELIDTVVRIGNSSGRDVDKFEEFGLTPRKARKVGAPLIDECYASFECRLHDHRMVRRYSLFIWEIVAAHVARTPANPATIHYRGKGEFRVAGRTLSRRRLFKPGNL